MGAREDGGEADVGGDEFCAEGFGKGADRALGKCVDGIVGQAHQADHAGDVHDVRLVLFSQYRQERVAPVEHTPYVDVDDPVEVRESFLLERAG